MINCLILYHTTISSLTKSKMLRFIFKDEDFEINVVQNNAVIIYVWNVKKKAIWQVATDLESANISVGYGVGKLKREAKRQAQEKLYIRLYGDYPSYNHIQEEWRPYQAREKTS